MLINFSKVVQKNTTPIFIKYLFLLIMNYNDCAMCMQPINNPICCQCYLKQINSWIEDTGFNKIDKTTIVKEIKKSISQETLSEEKCVICSKESIVLCSHCFFSKTYQTLLRLNIPENFIQVFFTIFSYIEISVEEKTC